MHTVNHARKNGHFIKNIEAHSHYKEYIALNNNLQNFHYAYHQARNQGGNRAIAPKKFSKTYGNRQSV